MSVLIVPVAFSSLVGLLMLATHLEDRRARVLVRMTLRARDTSPEATEALVAAELAPLLASHGMGRAS